VIQQIALAAFTIHALSLSASVPKPVIDRTSDAAQPALCVVEYAYTQTDPQSGQSSKNSSSALGVLVSPDGLIMAHRSEKYARDNDALAETAVDRGSYTDFRKIDFAGFHKDMDWISSFSVRGQFFTQIRVILPVREKTGGAVRSQSQTW